MVWRWLIEVLFSLQNPLQTIHNSEIEASFQILKKKTFKMFVEACILFGMHAVPLWNDNNSKKKNYVCNLQDRLHGFFYTPS